MSRIAFCYCPPIHFGSKVLYGSADKKYIIFGPLCVLVRVKITYSSYTTLVHEIAHVMLDIVFPIYLKKFEKHNTIADEILAKLAERIFAMVALKHVPKLLSSDEIWETQVKQGWTMKVTKI